MTEELVLNGRVVQGGTPSSDFGTELEGFGGAAVNGTDLRRVWDDFKLPRELCRKPHRN